MTWSNIMILLFFANLENTSSLIEALQFGKIWKLGFIILCEKFAVKWMWFILSMAEIVYK